MNDTVYKFFSFLKETFPDNFKNVTVVDFGACDINGNLRGYFENSKYIGVDVGEGKNVDEVSLAHEYAANDNSIDTVISSEMLEHDKYYEQSLNNMVRILKPRGLLALSCRTGEYPEHGTLRTNPSDSFLSCKLFNDYYKNIREGDIRFCIPVDSIFSNYEFEVGEDRGLYFWGIKK